MSNDTLDHTARIRDLERQARDCRQTIERQQCLLHKLQAESDYLTREHGIATSEQSTSGRWRKVSRSTIVAVQESRDEGMTFSAIGAALGISAATACQIYAGKYHNQAAILAGRDI